MSANTDPYAYLRFTGRNILNGPHYVPSLYDTDPFVEFLADHTHVASFWSHHLQTLESQEIATMSQPTPKDQQRKQIEHNFTYHAPHGDQQARYVQLREKAKELALLIADLTPPSREQSLALTHLEETTFWANASIARNE